LYPGHHNLVANMIFDPAVAGKPLYLGTHQRDEFYTEEPLNRTLKSVDRHFRDFLETLMEKGYLGCINLVIVSDHGMSRVRSHILLNDYVNVDDFYATYGSQTQIFLKKSTSVTEDDFKLLGCRTGKNARIFSQPTMPIRFHYPKKTARIGDLNMFHRGSGAVRWDRHGTHGQDYIEPPLHTIMFAMGPSFKENYVLPAFMNVEYMNLWAKLLGIPLMKNDGDPVFMDMALRNHTTPHPNYKDTRVCTTSSSPQYCGACSKEEEDIIKKWATCKSSPISQAITLQEFPESSGDFCFLVHSGTLIELYNRDSEDEKLSSDCIFQLTENRETQCAEMKDAKKFMKNTISAYPENVMAHEWNLIPPLKPRFIEVYLDPLNNYTREIVSKRGQVISITGWVYNYNYDGMYSKLQPHRTEPTHIFRILIACKKNWSENGPYCEKSEDTEALSFILPHVEIDHNCLSQKELLLQYSARVKDVEQISGQYFNLTKLPYLEQLKLKLHVITELW
uniref:NUC domain-containing protein n=1 Tax=Haemonchus placei TaxID=6290 RepID=A0A0N4WYQ8_HAEPC